MITQFNQHELIATVLTDTIGTVLVEGDDRDEPHPGSVLLTQGWWGTAWQRYFSDGLWHRLGEGCEGINRPVTWEWLLSQRNVILIYDADTRG